MLVNRTLELYRTSILEGSKIMAAFEEKVLRARSELGLTQSELAEAVGVSLRTISDYEKGRKSPRQSTLLALAKALKVSTKFLSDPDCENPLEDIEKDGYIEEARERYGAAGAHDVDQLLEANKALFAGGDLSEDQKDVFFQAVMAAYVASKEEAKRKFGHKK